ncbi:MAG: hypothetical protein H6571_21995 [Lewinellaceae bacterium]|nr:hypothetical protein [Lewinellaceae bacterium]
MKGVLVDAYGTYAEAMSPVIGAVFMSLSTIIVAINAQLLKRKIGKKI